MQCKKLHPNLNFRNYLTSSSLIHPLQFRGVEGHTAKRQNDNTNSNSLVIMTSSFAAVVPTPYFFAKFEHYLGMSSFTVAGLFQAFNEYAANHQLQVLVGTIGAIAVARVIVKYVFASKRLEKNVNDSSATRTLTSKAFERML